MASHLSVATVIEKNRISSIYAFVAALQIEVIDPVDNSLVETLYLVDNTENITFQGQIYTATKFDAELRKEAGAMTSLTVTATDYTRAIQARMQSYGGGVGFNVVFMVINTGNLEQPAEIKESFTVTAANAKDYIISFTLGAENPLSRRFPFRMQYKDRCPWLYKGVECKYAGALTTCDYTLQGANGCAAHSNSENFGAFPGIKAVSQ